jgi:hypothetical protein
MSSSDWWLWGRHRRRTRRPECGLGGGIKGALWPTTYGFLAEGRPELAML